MIITSRIDIINNSYHVTIGLDPGPDALTEVEKNALAAFGEPIISLGGTFTPTNPATNPVSFTLPVKDLRFPSQAPFTQIFPVTTYTLANAAAYAAYYRTAIKTAIDVGVDTKTALATTNVGRWTDTV